MNKDYAISFLRELISYNTEKCDEIEGCPFGKTLADCLDRTLKEFEKFGFKTKNIDNFCGYAEIGEGEMFGILNHIDVVPAGDSWTYKPYELAIEDGKMIGRGTLDDKGPLVAIMWAITELLEEGYKPNKKIRFIIGCDEESGWSCIDRYLKTEEMPEIGISPDGDFPVINCEKGILHLRITTKCPSNVEKFIGGDRANMVPAHVRAVINGCDVAYDGKSAHGSRPMDGVNAITRLFQLLGKFDEQFNTLYRLFSDYNGEGLGIRCADSISGELTTNLGVVKKEDDNLVMDLDIRYPVTMESDIIIKTLSNIDIFSKVLVTYHHKPLYVPENNELVQKLLKAYNKVMGTNEKPIAIGGGTYARALKCGVAFGPCFPGGNDGMHCPDEYIGIADFEKMKDIYKEALKSICLTM